MEFEIELFLFHTGSITLLLNDESGFIFWLANVSTDLALIMAETMSKVHGDFLSYIRTHIFDDVECEDVHDCNT